MQISEHINGLCDKFIYVMDKYMVQDKISNYIQNYTIYILKNSHQHKPKPK